MPPKAKPTKDTSTANFREDDDVRWQSSAANRSASEIAEPILPPAPRGKSTSKGISQHTRVRLGRQQPKQSNATTRRLAVMNLALRGIEADFGPEHADTFRRDLHPDLRPDYVLANPPFNDSATALRDSAFLQTGGTLQVMAQRQDNFRKDDDVRWQFGVPPKGNANFAWVQHSIHHLAPHGMAGFVLANGPDRSGSSNQSGGKETWLP